MDDHAFDDKVQSRRGRRRRVLLALLLSSSLATLGAGAMSLAVFTDSTANEGAWSTGTIVLGVTPATTFTAGNIFPGDDGTQDITVANNGTGELRYDMAGVIDTDPALLSGELDLVIYAGACGTGTELYNGPLGGASLTDRAVAAGADDDLCFAWSLPTATGNAFQGKTAVVDFTFAAEQTANNP